MTTEQEVWVTHRPCGHTWVAVHLPMEMAKAARLMKGLRCPKCGAPKEIFMASYAEIAASAAASDTCQHGVRDQRACHRCTPREDDFYVTGHA